MTEDVLWAAIRELENLVGRYQAALAALRDLRGQSVVSAPAAKTVGKKTAPAEPKKSLKKQPKTVYMASQAHIVTAIEAAGEPLSTHRLRECLAAVNIKPSDEQFKKVMKLAQDRGIIKLGDDAKWRVVEGED